MNRSRAGDYIVIKHALKDINGVIGGVKFRGGYAVVERNSKIYQQIKKLPMIKGQPEFSLLHLKDLPFITRTADVKLIFGNDVYNKYRTLLEEFVEDKQQKEIAEAKAQIENRCCFILPTGEQCSFSYADEKISKHCKRHILEDPNIENLVKFKIPKTMTKAELKEYKQRVCKKLGI